MRTVLNVAGTRPQFVKAAALSRALRASPIREVVVDMGQHRDASMSKTFFDELEIPIPTACLGVSGGSHANMTARMMQAFEPVLEQYRPDGVICYGDSNTTLAAALVAAKAGVKVAHVEAGLRSFVRAMPEEINRIAVDHISDLLFAPTKAAMEHLEREGLGGRAHLVGDVMYDVAGWTRQRARSGAEVLLELGLLNGDYAVATVHRAESTATPETLSKIIDWLNERAREIPVVLPLHPRTRQAARAFGLGFGRLRVIPPASYLDMARLVAGARVVFTDSGGLQKEAMYHRVPCVTLRDETEWPETIETGWNRLWTASDYRPRRDPDLVGDGRASEAIVRCLLEA